MLPPNSAGTMELRASPFAGAKRMQRDFHLVVVIEGLKGAGIAGVVDRIEPDFFRQRRMEHRRVIGFVEGPEAWRERADALIAVNLQVQNVDNQRVAGFRAFDEKRAGERIVSLDERKSIARILNRVAKTIQRVRFQNIPRTQACNRRRDAEDILHGVDRGVILNDLGFGWRGWSLSQPRVRQNQTESNEMETHKEPPRIGRRSSTHSCSGVNSNPHEPTDARRSAILFLTP